MQVNQFFERIKDFDSYQIKKNQLSNSVGLNQLDPDVEDFEEWRDIYTLR